MSIESGRDLALAAFAALEMDRLEQVRELGRLGHAQLERLQARGPAERAEQGLNRAAQLLQLQAREPGGSTAAPGGAQ